MPKISDQALQEYFNETKKHPLYKETVQMYEALQVHASGDFPVKLLDDQRPNEPVEIKEYRKKNYQPVTKKPLGQVFSSLSKIRRSTDWGLTFDSKTVTANIRPDEAPEAYINNLPVFGSLTDWAFSILLRQNGIDANAVVLVVPLAAVANNEYLKPVPLLFNSPNVYGCDPILNFFILKSATGKRFYYVDDLEFIIWDKIDNEWTITLNLPVKFGEVPAWKVAAEKYREVDGIALHRSRLDAMVPFLNLACMEHSDLFGSKIQHMHPQMWYYQDEDCKTCNGTGRVPTEGGPKPCTKCDNGKVKFSPYSTIRITGGKLGQQQVPVPGAGYVERPTEILEMQEKSWERNIYKALGTLNMQFLDQTPLSVSGDAKQVDREELNNTVYNYAEDIVWSCDRVARFAIQWRYIDIVPDKKARLAMAPQIPVPQNFDLLPSEYLLKEVTDARTGKVNPYLIATMEKELAVKKYYNDPKLAANVGLYYDLDPLSGVNVDDKIQALMNKAITQKDFVISTYMAQFVKRALLENTTFQTMKYAEQMKILERYADEKIKANDAAQQVADEAKAKVLEEMKANTLVAA